LSLTLDNGKEFARHEDIALNTHIDVFFVRPYHSWERGTNEMNGGAQVWPCPSRAPLRGRPNLYPTPELCLRMTALLDFPRLARYYTPCFRDKFDK
jgi:hypothetical protein